MNEQGACDRLSARHTVLLLARCRKSIWNVFPVELADISQGGCCILGSEDTFELGEDVQLRIANLKPIDGDVRWLRWGRVGIEFRVPLLLETSEQIRQTYGITVGERSER